MAYIAATGRQVHYDRQEKMPRYAAAGVPEAWLVDVRARETTVYAEPRTDGYGRSRTLAWNEEIVSTAVKGLSQ